MWLYVFPWWHTSLTMGAGWCVSQVLLRTMLPMVSSGNSRFHSHPTARLQPATHKECQGDEVNRLDIYRSPRRIVCTNNDGQVSYIAPRQSSQLSVSAVRLVAAALRLPAVRWVQLRAAKRAIPPVDMCV